MAALVDRLRERLPGASGRTLKQLLEHGRVRVDGVVVRRGDLETSDEAKIEILPKETPREVLADSALRIVHEDASLLVADKPPGLLTAAERDDGRPSAWSLLRRRASERGDPPPLLVHRLDAPASGLLVFAKSELMRNALKDLFASHAIDRHYAAVVEGALPGETGVFRSSLVELPDRMHRVRSVRRGDPTEMHDAARASLTRWRRIASRGALHALEVRLETGRKHQIRVHLAEAGCPIVGDELYGGRKAPRLLLHAWVLGFVHPQTGRRLALRASPGRSFRVAGRDAFGGDPQLRPLEAAAAEDGG
ncbi:MAG TPA: RluA family pseudouridine synthase [Planctomycetota bacterium]|nr:RluA family pseudouridine synthase [Planctomycetota bacterium]